jgi:DNA mismatch repair protein MutL
LSSNGRDVIRVTAVASLHDRAYQLLGPALIERLVAVEAEAGGITVSGYVSNPQERRSSRDAQYLFVNDRYVKDRALSRAIAEAYRSMMPSGTFPAVVLFVRLPAEHVDVNVHPAKTEVRFHREHEVRQAVVGAIREALAGSTRPVASFPVPLPAPPRSLNQEGVPAPRQQPATDAAIRAQAPLWRGASAAASSRPAAAASPGAATAARRTTAAEIADIAIERLRPLGQIRESFIVATDDEGLLLVDQHVAHERILFERFRAAGGDCVRQRLLIPETIDLTPAQVLALAKIRADLEHAGFELLELSGRTMAITAVPVDLPQSELRSLVLELLDGSDAAGSALACARDEIAASMACKAAIKINMPLTEEKMTWLLQELLATEDPWTCPHGRPIILRYGLRGIEQQFHRR